MSVAIALIPRAARPLAAFVALATLGPAAAWAQEVDVLGEDIPAASAEGDEPGDEFPEFTPPADDRQDEADRFLDPDAADFGEWTPLVERPDRDVPAPFSSFEEARLDPADEGESELRPFDWMRHWGFHHSSTEGPFRDRGIPMERTSWLNRPYHVDWFLGPLLSGDPVDGRVEQSNELLGGLRAGWDFDYYWGVEWRFGWADPDLVQLDSDTVTSGTYFVSDVDFLYYPWGDTKIRPYLLAGVGLTQVGSVRADGTGQEATLLGMPLGVGVQFPQTHWLAWRLEVIDNIAFGADSIDTMNNFAFTAGMEVRLGARPNSYWPWRSSRDVW
ncbi:MAG TPA: hypothetical protein VEQ85_12735 [Lacipirellulaceae bacterium]|nr:hypothetical protein [Lacipirellulaceae bacterium]